MSFFQMKEPVNTWTHFVTFISAIIGLIVLVALTWHNISQLIIVTIYGSSVIFLYGASSLYHWVKTTRRKELILKKLDHAAIYVLIAGSYTPVFYYGLNGVWQWAMLAAVWLLAVIGILIKMRFIHTPRWLSTTFYVVLGWIAIVPFFQLMDHLSTTAIVLMFVGGAAYTLGAVIYATKMFDFFPNRFGFHEIFHLFIMAGSISHFVMIAWFVVPI